MSAGIQAEPSDQLGDLDMPPWAGLWTFEKDNLVKLFDVPQTVGIIIVRQPDHAMTMFTYDSEAELREAWADMEKSIENPNPQDGDFIIWSVATVHEDDSTYEVWHSGYKRSFPDHLDSGKNLRTRENALRYTRMYAHLNDLPLGNVWLFDGVDYFLMEMPPDEI